MHVEQMTMPQLGESVTEGTISQWLVNVGDTVQKYDPIAEVTTDKVNAEVPSSFSGKIISMQAREGDTLPVGRPICSIEVADPDGKDQTIPNQDTQKMAHTAESEMVSERADTSMKKRYSPAVLRLAQENAIDLESVMGTGRGGRITRKDVLSAIELGARKEQDRSTQKSETAQAPVRGAGCFSEAVAQEAGTPTEKPAVKQTRSEDSDRNIPLTSVRRTIARNMVRSKTEIPHAWTMVEVDVTGLVNYRNQVKHSFQQKEGRKLTYLPFFIKAIVTALKEFPRMNSTWAGDRIIEKQAINLSLAVAAEDALYVPVIKHADEKSIKGLAFAVDGLAAKVRENRLTPDDMQGGTFTVNNTGSFGSIQSQPIINYPQAAILSVESIVKRPVVINDMIAIRDMVNLCISIDHRVLDGLITGRFLARVKEILESITSENTPIY